MSDLTEITGPLDYSIAMIDAIELCMDRMVNRDGHLPTVEVRLLTEWRTAMSLLSLTRDQVRMAFQAADKMEGLLS